MADGMKQYEIVFLLKAALDSSMQQFSAMGGKIKELEQKVQQYQQTIGKIEAFQKQSAEVQKLEEKYRKTNESLTEATQKFNAATAAVQAANQGVQQHAANIGALNVRIAQEKTHIAETEVSLKQKAQTVNSLNVQESEHRAEIERINQSITQEKTKLAEVENELKKEGTDIQTLTVKKAEHRANIERLNQSLTQEKTKLAETQAALKQESAATDALNVKKAEHKAKIAELNESLTREKQALQGSQDALKAAKAEEEKARQSKNALQNASDRTKEKLEKERNALQQTTEALRKMGVDTTKLDAEILKLNSELTKTREELDKTAAFKNSLNGLADQFMVMNTAARAILPTLDKINGFFGSSIQLAGDLQFRMSSVEAISGASASDMEKLTAVAKEMGATTRYTAMDAANSLQQMALAGWEAEGMVAALPGVVNLAASANEDLSDMTRILVDGMNAFGMSGTENAQKFADVLAKAATSSSTNVAQLGRALEACQGTAGNLGYTIEDVGTLLAAMANNGIKASVAGTALNTLLTRLSGGIKNAEDTMKGLGVSMYYASDGFGHAAGEAKPLLKFMNELREGFKQFGDNAKDAQTAAYTLAGMRGMKGLLSITNMSDAAWEKLCDDVSQYAGATKEIAGISMDNYRGQLYLLTSAWDALKTSVGEKFLPTAKEALSVLTDWTTGADRFVQSHGNLVRFIVGFTTSLAGLLVGLTAVAGAIQLVRMAFTTLGVGALAGVVGGFGSLVAIAVALGVALSALGFAIDELAAKQDAEVEVSRKLAKKNQELSQSYENVCAEIEENRGSAKNLAAELDELSKKEQKSALDKQRIQQICEELNASLPDLALSYDKESDSLTGLNESLDDYVKRLYDAQRMEADVSQMSKLYGSMRDTSEQLDIVNEKIAEYKKNQRLTGEGFSGDELKNINTLMALIRVAEELENQYKDAEDAYNSLLKKYGETPEKTGAAESAVSRLNDTFTSVQNQLQAINEAYDDAYEDAYESVTKQYKLWDEVGKAEIKSLKEVTKNVERQIESWRQYQQDLEYLGSLTPDIPGLSETLKMISDGTEESRAYAREMAEAARNSNGEVYALSEKVGELSQLHTEVAGTMSDAAVGVEQSMNGMKDAVKAAVEEMNSKNEAALSAKETMEAFVDTIDGYKGRVSDSLGEIRKTVIDALNGINAKIAALDAAAARARGTADKTAARTSVIISGSGKNTWAASTGGRMPVGFASGTLSAPSGMALVGEQGPEIVYMRGGEKVITAAETRRLRQEAQLLQKSMPDSVRMAESPSTADSQTEFALLRRNIETVRLLEQSAKERKIPGYASGTSNAAPGAAIVGERGSELMLMRGGERIIPATRTAQIIQAAQSGTPRGGNFPEGQTETAASMEETSRVIRAVSEKTARMQHEVSRTIRIIQESAGNRTTVQETIRAFQAFRNTERTIREAEMSKTSDSSTRIIRAAENQSRLVRELERERSIEETFRTAQSRNAKAESQFSSVTSILRILGGGTGSVETQTALRILREREYTERERRQRETYQYNATVSEAPLNIESYRAYRGGSDSGAIYINLSVEYNIDGVSDTETLREALRSAGTRDYP